MPESEAKNAGYAFLFERYHHLLPDWSCAIELFLTPEAFCGPVSVRLLIPAEIVNNVQAGQTKEFLRIRASSNPKGPCSQRLDDSASVDVQDFQSEAPDGVQLIQKSTKDGATISIQVGGMRSTGSAWCTFTSLTLQTPLSERAPGNRALMGVSIEQLGEKTVPLRLVIVRPNSCVTCFTKGNYCLSFPSRPGQSGSKAIILYRDSRFSWLKYAYSPEPREAIVEVAKGLLLSSLAAISLWIMSGRPSGFSADYMSIVGALTALCVPLYKTFGSLIELDQHTFYVRRANLGYLLSSFTLVAFTFNLLLVTVLIARGTPTAGRWREVFLVEASFFGLASLALLVCYRVGFFVRYVCDLSDCHRRLYLRFRRGYCNYTGRVMCVQCRRKHCDPCKTKMKEQKEVNPAKYVANCRERDPLKQVASCM